MARRTKEDAQKTRGRILDAAIEVFHDRGVATPSLTEVAELAGVTRGAVYGHFTNKSDVFAALCDRIRLPLEAACQSTDADVCDDPLGALGSGWVDFLQHTARDVQQRKILTIVVHRCELLEANGAILQRIKTGREEGLAHMKRLLSIAVARGQLPANLNIDRALVFFHTSVMGLLSDWLLGTDSFDLAGVSPQIVEALKDALQLSPALRDAEP